MIHSSLSAVVAAQWVFLNGSGLSKQTIGCYLAPDPGVRCTNAPPGPWTGAATGPYPSPTKIVHGWPKLQDLAQHLALTENRY